MFVLLIYCSKFGLTYSLYFPVSIISLFTKCQFNPSVEGFSQNEGLRHQLSPPAKQPKFLAP